MAESDSSTKETNCCCPSKIETSIDINAPVQRVWDIMMNGGGHNNWDPFMKDCAWSINTMAGETTAATLDGQYKFTPLVITHNKNDEFRWRGNILCDCCCYGEHVFIAQENGSNKTHFIQNETFGGCLSNVCCCCYPCLLLAPTSNNFVKLNKALKQEAEKQDK